MSIYNPISHPCNRLESIINNENGFISHHSSDIELLKNGIECYFVEVTSRNGVQFGIWAHGSEAKNLYQHTMRILNIQNYN
jgi:hypothetical protein